MCDHSQDHLHNNIVNISPCSVETSSDSFCSFTAITIKTLNSTVGDRKLQYITLYHPGVTCRGNFSITAHDITEEIDHPDCYFLESATFENLYEIDKWIIQHRTQYIKTIYK